MMLHKIVLQHFRSYTQQTFSFTQPTTCIIGPNTAGKTNIMEGIFLLATGKSFRAEKDTQMIQFGQEVGRVQAAVGDTYDPTRLEVAIASLNGSLTKKYMVNSVPRSRMRFTGYVKALLFTPSDLDIIVGSPSLRRSFLDDVLEQVDEDYKRSLLLYTKALRQRNALLSLAQETGQRNVAQFQYWDELLITHGSIVTNKRRAFIDFVNSSEKLFLPFQISYDASLISPERLLQYKDAELSAGVTLVGPHRDDFVVIMEQNNAEVRYFGSRGQQRLVVLQLKLSQLSYMEQQLGTRPLLLLDDVFSELDEGHIKLILSLLGKQQTILTTTHEEFIDYLEDTNVEKVFLGQE